MGFKAFRVAGEDHERTLGLRSPNVRECQAQKVRKCGDTRSHIDATIRSTLKLGCLALSCYMLSITKRNSLCPLCRGLILHVDAAGGYCLEDAAIRYPRLRRKVDLGTLTTRTRVRKDYLSKANAEIRLRMRGLATIRLWNTEQKITAPAPSRYLVSYQSAF